MRIVFAYLAMTAYLAYPAASQEKLQQGFTTSDGKYLTISTGPDEPASIGSYAVRLYGRANPSFPADDFLSGIVVSRDGTLSSTGWHDITGDGIPELVITSETAGSGNYHSAHAISLSDNTLALVASLASLMPQDDEIAALVAQFRDKAPQ